MKTSNRKGFRWMAAGLFTAFAALLMVENATTEGASEPWLKPGEVMRVTHVS